MTAIILDTESTGFHEPQCIELAWLKINNPTDLQIVESFNQRYKPTKPIELGALATHGIYDEELKDCPPYIEATIPLDISYVIGHNIDYDIGVLGNPGIKRICTLALSRYFWPDLDSHKQSAMLYHLERSRARDMVKNAHCALDDVINCAVLLDHIVKAIGKKPTWQELWDLSEIARIPTRMPFGKHSGMLIKDVPYDYIRWLKKQPDLDPYLKIALTR